MCFINSYSHLNSRRLWNLQVISWMHLVQLCKDFNEFTPKSLHLCPKLKKSHIELTSFSRMNVSLAAHVFSITVYCALNHFYGERVRASCKLIYFLNRWVDMMNTKSCSESCVNRDVDLNAYSSINDPRLMWLENDFLGYFENWRRNVDERPSIFSQSDKSKMQLSHQTLNG